MSHIPQCNLESCTRLNTVTTEKDLVIHKYAIITYSVGYKYHRLMANPAWSRRLDEMAFKGPFQPELSYDPVFFHNIELSLLEF